MKQLLLLVTTLIFTGFLYAQPNDDNWRDGSAKQLKGKVFTVCCFVSSGKHSWKKSEKEIALFKLREAYKWLQSQAESNGVKVNFYDTATSDDADIKVDKIYQWKGEGKDTGNLGVKVLNAAGHPTLMSYYDSLLQYTHCDNIQVILFPAISGRSYAASYRKGGDKEKRFLECVTVYQTDYRGNDIRISTIAHEILHLYGAWDLYQSHNQQEGVEKKSKSILLHSIMLDDINDFNGRIVDEVTAWLIGWFPTYYPYYENFRPKNRY